MSGHATWEAQPYGQHHLREQADVDRGKTSLIQWIQRYRDLTPNDIQQSLEVRVTEHLLSFWMLKNERDTETSHCRFEILRNQSKSLLLPLHPK